MGYYFEVWLRGFAKDFLREIAMQDNEAYHPHITFVRPFKILTSEEKVQNKVVSLCQGRMPMPFSLEGKASFDGKINYVPVADCSELLKFNDELENILEKDVKFVEKLNDGKILHSTLNVGKDVIDCPRIDQYMLRLTGIRDKKIWFSYDFVSQMALNREESLDRAKWYATVHAFSERFGLLPTRKGYQKIEGK